MATIKDVAREAGVSIATASRVMNNAPYIREHTRHNVLQAMSRLGYRPNANARALVNKSSNTIGVLVNDLSSPFFGNMVKVIDDVANEQKMQLLIGSGYHDAEKERKAIELLINSQCKSLVIHSKGLSDQELIRLAKEIPGMVLINRYIKEIASRCIALDNRKGAYMATEHMIRSGHKHIGYLCSTDDIDDAHDRKNGYLEALKDNGLTSNEEYIEYCEPTEKGGEQAMRNLIAKNLPVTAVATYNDNMAAGCLTLLQENGYSVPRDFSIIGFDDNYIAQYIYPRLTTIAYPIELMAKEAVKLSIALVKEQALPQERKLFLPVVVSRSTVSQ